MIYVIFNGKRSYDAYTIQDDGVCCFERQSALGVLKELCIHHGCSYEGRKEAAGKVLNISQKIPILVSDKRGDIFFPTRRIRHPNCMWVNRSAITNLSRFQSGTKIEFRNGKTIVVLVDIRSIKRELQLCDELLHLLAQPLEDKV